MTRSWSHVVTLQPSKGQSEESIQADLDRSTALAEHLIEQGVRKWHSRFRRIGPFKVMLNKEVGPPPWPWPRIAVHRKLNPPTCCFVVGWRSTAFRLFLMYQPEPI